jgi:hypothetical protein
MPSANLLKQWMWTGVVFVAIFASTTSQIHASTARQTCQQGSLCTIGEFVYTDAAVPITNATCQFTSFTPSGQSFVNAASLTGTADGWYAYSFTPDQNTAVGSYPSQLCCQTSENNLCIDKSFEVTALPDPGLSTDDISGAVWNATLSGYTQPGSVGEKIDTLQNNTLTASDIWSFSGRTLSNFGTLVTDIWGSANRTLTGFGSLVADVTTSIWSAPNKEVTSVTNTQNIADNVWNNSNRSLTDTQNIIDNLWNANPADYTNPDSFGNKIDTTTNLSAQEVWEYQQRELTGTQNIAASVWDYQNRSLNSFSNIVTSIWSADDRTATDPTGATAASISVLEREIKAAQTLIQQLAAQTAAGQSGSEAADYAALLETKLETTKTYLSEISNNMEIISTRLGLLSIKWDQLSDTDRIQELEQILALLGTQDSSDRDTLIGQLSWFTRNWPKNSTTTLYQNVTNLRTDINDFITAIQISPSDESQTAIINQLFAAASSLKADVGDISQSETSASLYGQYKSNRALAEALASQLRILNNTLTDWDRLSLADRDTIVNALSQDIGLLNRFSALKILMSPVAATPGFLHNLKSVITANQAVLASSSEPVVLNWIGTDATAYHTFIYNPSKTTPQTANVNYFLPSELTTENLSLTPTPLTTTFDPSQNAIAVTGSPTLDPEAHALHTIITSDIWQINPAHIDTMRLQAKSLTATLEKSPLYPQAMVIKQNIDQALDTILQLQTQTHTPEAKIQAYRQIQTLKQSVDQGLTELQNLANSQENSNSLMGFIGGVQAVAVWGMIVIVIAGFIFLSLYMRALYQQTQVEIHGEPELSLPLSGPALALPAPRGIPSSGMEWGAIHLPISFNLDGLTQRRFMVMLVLFSSLLLTTVALKHQPNSPRRSAPVVVPPTIETVSQPAVRPSPAPTAEPSPLPLAPLEPAESPTKTSLLISPPDIGSTVNVRRLPTTDSAIVATITTEEAAQEATKSGNWIQVDLFDRDPIITGWINQNFALILPQ